MKEPIYLDYAAATPVDSKVLEAMLPFFTNEFSNPSAIHTQGRAASAVLEKARESVARTIGARPPEIVFTAGGTESINLALHGATEPGDEIIISGVEHDAVRKAAARRDMFVCGVDKNGVIDLKELETLISDKTRLISVIHSSNEIGTVQPIKEIASIVSEVNKQREKSGNELKLLFHTDASQSPNYLDIHVKRLGADLMTLNGGKIYGPKQSGILYVKAGLQIQPQILGGGQENGMRSGTENVAFAVGFAKSLEIASENRKEESRRLEKLTGWFINELQERFGAMINGHKTHRLANNVNACFEGKDNERILFALDDSGIMAAAGSACSASSDEPSAVLKAIGLSDKQAQSSIRFSFGRGTTKKHLESTLEALAVALQS